MHKIAMNCTSTKGQIKLVYPKNCGYSKQGIMESIQSSHHDQNTKSS